MYSRLLLVLYLLRGLEVNSQTFPYVSFAYFVIPNHGYINIHLVGTSFINSVQCRTDLSTCCRSEGEDHHNGQWYFPNGSAVQNQDSPGDADIYQIQGNMSVDIRRNNRAISPTGVYRCEIPTIALQDNNISMTATVYVGLYSSGGILKLATPHY